MIICNDDPYPIRKDFHFSIIVTDFDTHEDLFLRGVLDAPVFAKLPRNSTNYIYINYQYFSGVFWLFSAENCVPIVNFS